jgi:hypothetical protein
MVESMVQSTVEWTVERKAVGLDELTVVEVVVQKVLE